MKMVKNKILIFSLISVLISCEQNKDTSKSLSNSNNKNKIITDKILNFEFPDTVRINKLVNGKLEYNLYQKDSIFEERNIFLYVTTSKEKEIISLENIIKTPNLLIEEDTIGNGAFSFQAVFTKSGKNSLHCIIEDIIFLNESDKIKKDTEAIINQTNISKSVFVIRN